MKRWEMWGGVAVFVAVAIVGPVGLGEDKDKTSDKPAAKATKETTGKAPPKTTKSAKETKHRLPRYYGKLGLSDAQRDKIYGIQDKYQTDIDKLEKQLADLKSRQDADCRTVLNSDQKKQLTETIEAAKAKGAKADEEE